MWIKLKYPKLTCFRLCVDARTWYSITMDVTYTHIQLKVFLFSVFAQWLIPQNIFTQNVGFGSDFRLWVFAYEINQYYLRVFELTASSLTVDMYYHFVFLSYFNSKLNRDWFSSFFRVLCQFLESKFIQKCWLDSTNNKKKKPRRRKSKIRNK